MSEAVGAGDLHHRPVGRETAAENDEPTAALQRTIDGTHDFLAGGLRRALRLIRNRPPSYGFRGPVQYSALEEPARDEGTAARGIQIGGDETARWLEIGDERDPGADAIEIAEGQAERRFMGNGNQMQYRIGRPAGGRDRCDRVFERFSRDDVPGHLVRSKNLGQRLDVPLS